MSCLKRTWNKIISRISNSVSKLPPKYRPMLPPRSAENTERCQNHFLAALMELQRGLCPPSLRLSMKAFSFACVTSTWKPEGLAHGRVSLGGALYTLSRDHVMGAFGFYAGYAYLEPQHIPVIHVVVFRYESSHHSSHHKKNTAAWQLGLDADKHPCLAWCGSMICARIPESKLVSSSGANLPPPQKQF